MSDGNQRLGLAGSPSDNSDSFDDQQSANVLLTHLRDTAETYFTTGRMLTWNNADPSRKVAATFDCFGGRSKDIDRSCRHRADA